MRILYNVRASNKDPTLDKTTKSWGKQSKDKKRKGKDGHVRASQTAVSYLPIEEDEPTRKTRCSKLALLPLARL